MGHSECARLKEHKILRRYSTFRSLGKIIGHRDTVSRDGESLQRRDRYRLKALTLTFQTVPVSSL